MEEFWRRIEAIGPDDRASVVIDSDLAEVVDVLQRLTERAAEQEGAVDHALGPVVELDLELVAVKRFDCMTLSIG